MPAILKTTQIIEPSSSTVNLLLDSSGKVAIGGVTPGQQFLTVGTGNGESGIVIRETSTNGRTYEIITGGTAGSFSGGAFGIYDRTAGAVRLLIDANGNIGLQGSTNSSYKLDLISSAIRHGDLYHNNQKVAYNRGWDNYPSITVENDTTIGPCSEFRIHGSGGASGGDFSVNLRIDGSSVFTSDARIKTNVESIPYGIDEVLKLKPILYDRLNSRGEIENKDKKVAGFIAQEVNQVLPEAVSYYPDEDKPNEKGWARAYSLNMDTILATAIKAIQDQQLIIESLKRRIETLESNSKV